jgi:hypothetical protein
VPARAHHAQILARKGQTGRVRNYILALTTGGAVVVLVFVWIW